ncbi:MAG: YdcF family protein [Pseudomonadota bacterium]
MDRYLIWTLVKPTHALVWLALAGIVLRRRRAGRWLLCTVAALLLAVALLPLGAALTVPLEQRFAPPPPDAVPDGIIVLAGAEAAALTGDHGDPQLYDGADRLTTFVLLARRFPSARLVHSGSGVSKRPGDPSQSAVAQALLLGAGLAPERLTFEARSTNTCNSPSAVAAAVAPGAGERWWLVTSAFHMPRAMACYRAAGWEVLPYPTDYRYTRSPGWWPPNLAANLAHIDLAMHEWLGLAFYRLTGATDELYPAPAR